MKILSSEEKYARYVWYVLDKMKGQLLLKRDKRKPITYILQLYPRTNGWDEPNPTVEQQLLEQLKGLGVMEETDQRRDFQSGKEDETENPKSAGSHYYFKVNEDILNKYFAKYQKLVEQYDKADKEGNTLIFNENGEVTYISPKGETYQAELKLNTNYYNLLNFLANHPHHVYSFDELAKSFSRGSLNSDNERQVRDAVQTIKKKLQYREDDIFESAYGFGLKCNVQIIKR